VLIGRAKANSEASVGKYRHTVTQTGSGASESLYVKDYKY